MDNKKDYMLIAFVFSSICGFIIFLLYYLPIFALKAVFEVDNAKDFVFSMYASIQFGIWFVVALSCLLGFFSVVMLLISGKSYKEKRRVSNCLLFFITAFAVLSTFFYYGVFHKILMRDNGTFLYIIFTVVNFLMSIYLIYGLRYLFFYFYKTLLDAFSLNVDLFILNEQSSDCISDDEESEIVDNEQEDMVFRSSLYAVLAFAGRNKSSIGLTAYKIINKESLIREHGFDEYMKLERYLISVMTVRGREGENTFFVKNGYIASLLFASEEGASKAIESFNSLLEDKIFNSDVRKNVPTNFSNVRFVIAAAGFDFSKMSATVSINVLIDKLYQKIEEALEEAEAIGAPVIYYE